MCSHLKEICRRVTAQIFFFLRRFLQRFISTFELFVVPEQWIINLESLHLVILLYGSHAVLFYALRWFSGFHSKVDLGSRSAKELKL